MNLTEPTSSSKVKLVIALVVVGIVLLAVAAFVAFRKRSGAASEAPHEDAAEVNRWCEIRAQWARRVDPMAGDIVLKSVQDKEGAEALRGERNKLCQQYARQVRELRSASTRIKSAEVALIKEGKVRANIAVEIANVEAQLSSTDTRALRAALESLRGHIKQRVAGGRAAADKEVASAMAAIPECKHIYRGPMTDEATADNPYLSWEELEFRRSSAVTAFVAAIKKLEPQEQWTHLVYHRLVSRYRAELKGCHAKFKKVNPHISDTMGLRVRLKKDGKVATLAIEWMDVREDGILDCLLKHAAKWSMPKPTRNGEYAVLTLDFSRL